MGNVQKFWKMYIWECTAKEKFLVPKNKRRIKKFTGGLVYFCPLWCFLRKKNIRSEAKLTGKGHRVSRDVT